MKSIRFFVVFTLLVLFPVTFFAADPETISNKMVTMISNNVTLTDSQKAAIKIKARIFVRNIQISDSNKSIEEKIREHRRFTSEYTMALDSILTTEQKEQLKQKQDEHKQTTLDKFLKKLNNENIQ